jgi:CRISPR system Cascade subunit CasD
VAEIEGEARRRERVAKRVFTLAANLAAMGDLAGHERRGSLAWPGRSAILGLLGAALGVERDGDFSALDAQRLAVATFDEGTPLRDYHTVESVPSTAVRRPNSRPEALAAAGLRTGTTITLRDYRAGSLYGIAVWGGDPEGCSARTRDSRST